MFYATYVVVNAHLLWSVLNIPEGADVVGSIPNGDVEQFVKCLLKKL